MVLDRLALATARPPRRGVDRSAADLDLPHELIEFPAFDGITLRGEWMESPGTRPDQMVVVLVHGWTGNSGTMTYVAEPLAAAGYPTFSVDVRRHGRSDDAPFVTIRHFRDDLRHALSEARRRRPCAQIAVVGHSLGGSAALLAAAMDAPIDAIALVAAPADLFEVTAGMFTDRGLPGNLITRVLRPFWQRRAGEPFSGLDPGARAAELTIPVLVVQGELDARVPAEHARRIAGNVGTEVVWIDQAAHKDILTRPELHDALLAFLGEVGRASGDESVDVLAAVVRAGDRYLVCRRPSGKRHGGLWEFPGGKVEAGESYSAAASRELLEELELRLEGLGNFLCSYRDPGSPYLVHFVEATVTGTPNAREHDDLRWATIADLRDLPLAPADRAFADRLAGSESNELSGA
jgi:pimeloyl-ACP methyl ester carboxylesterase/ADP-ribose pyrophosphatase YjhB (NUDIX family)